MSTVSVTLPEGLETFVDERVAGQGYGSSSDYICALIQNDCDKEHLRRLLLDGAASPPAGAVDEAYFAALRARGRSRKTG